METTVAKSRNNKALQSKLQPPDKYSILPGDIVRVFREQSGRWEVLFTVTRVTKNIISVTELIKFKPFNISAILHIESKSSDG